MWGNLPVAGVKILKTNDLLGCSTKKVIWQWSGDAPFLATFVSVTTPWPVAVSRSGENPPLLAVLEVEYFAACGSRSRPPAVEKTSEHPESDPGEQELYDNATPSVLKPAFHFTRPIWSQRNRCLFNSDLAWAESISQPAMSNSKSIFQKYTIQGIFGLWVNHFGSQEILPHPVESILHPLLSPSDPRVSSPEWCPVPLCDVEIAVAHLWGQGLSSHKSYSILYPKQIKLSIYIGYILYPIIYI